MRFTYLLPWWAIVALGAVIVLLARGVYSRTTVPLRSGRRAVLTALRAATLGLLAIFLLDPVRIIPTAAARDAVVLILVDVSRSMRLVDAGGMRRIDRAREVLQQDLLPRLGQIFRTEVLAFGDRLTPTAVDALAADARRSDLAGALGAARERYRDAPIAGIVVISDGGDTSGRDPSSAAPGDVPVFAIGIGSAEGLRDREVLGASVAEAPLAESVVDLGVSVVSHGSGTAPFNIRVLENGRVIEVRRVQPSADGSPIHTTFSVSPDPTSATLYTVEIPPAAGELTLENNSRRVLVDPPGRRRRVLFVEGAPGFEHSFLKRAWASDPGLEIDSVVRKGMNDQGAPTYFVQAAAERMVALSGGLPTTRAALFAYDAVVFGNMEWQALNRDQLRMTAEFVSERGGGLLVLGGRSFDAGGLADTPLEEVLPVELHDRRGDARPASGRIADPADSRQPYKLVLTADGVRHPLMRLGLSADESRRRWAGLPVLSSSARLGGPRPGAAVLAITADPSGSVRPLVAVQRYGRGRSMVFGGEASWRWKMLLPAADRTHERFWRQAARWLAAGAVDLVSLSQLPPASAGDLVPVEVLVNDGEFKPVPDATVSMTLTMPDGDERDWTAGRDAVGSNRYVGQARVAGEGVYRISAEARRGQAALGSAERWLLVGGGDREFADPKLNEDVLGRLAAASGGRYVRASEAGEIAGAIRPPAPREHPPERRGLWHGAWPFALVVLLLSAEWILRRRWGMR